MMVPTKTTAVTSTVTATTIATTTATTLVSCSTLAHAHAYFYRGNDIDNTGDY